MKKFIIGTAKDEMASLLKWSIWLFRVTTIILKQTNKQTNPTPNKNKQQKPPTSFYIKVTTIFFSEIQKIFH